MHPAAPRATVVGAARRAVLERTLTGRFWLRWHVALMLVGAFSVGFLANVALLHAPVQSIVLRWLVALVCGYLAWFALMRLWLAYVGVRPLGSGATRNLDASGAPDAMGWSPGTGRTGGVTFGGGGGRSGGGGASASFDGPAATSARVPAPPSSSGGGGVDLGDALSADDGVLLVVLALIVLALVATLGGVVVYVVHEAPQLLVDVAFGSALASGMAGTTRRVTTSLDWCESVWRATWKPFVTLAIGVLACAAAFTYAFPGARTLGEALALWRS